uniref:Uncharacterized protein n=2 Tax=Hemiselmis andersenii TaxID=464988 RepID=A0A7S1DT73_HEMAN|mmetsp:Transcript_2703/g.6355  ORF Transcript_2703/g.6355 Transcript_2703/m.6355 type:complete len:448 (+) Transcript_2703:82-1425(+)
MVCGGSGVVAGSVGCSRSPFPSKATFLLLLGLLLALTPCVDTARGGFPDEMPDFGKPDPRAGTGKNLMSQHLQYVQEDVDEWKWATTQSLQRPWVQSLYDLSASLQDSPSRGQTYTDLREHLDEHCNRVYNNTCEWQFSPPFDSKNAETILETNVKQSAAIVYVCCADAQEFQDLVWSIKFLDLNFNQYHNYPILIFHENFGGGQQNQIVQHTKSEVRFHKVHWKIPDFLDPNYVPRWYKGYSLGFRHMIRFWTVGIWEHPAMQEFKYYMRLDSDSFLIGRLWKDPFSFMAEADFKFGFIGTSTESKDFTPDLWEVTEAFRRSKGLEPEWFTGKWNGFSFYSNLEVGRVDYWQQPVIKEYLNLIDGAGGIFKVRWPESSIHFLAAMLFLHSQEMVQLVFIPYWHQNMVILPQPWVESPHKNPDGTKATAQSARQREEQQEKYTQKEL